MARITNVDLTVNFGATSHPIAATIDTRITGYYKKCYRYLYGIATYSADESTDAKGIIDSDEFRQELADLISHKVQLWNEAGKNNDGSVRPMPKWDLKYAGNDLEERNQFTDFLNNALETNENREYIDNCRLWGSDYSDRSGLYH